MNQITGEILKILHQADLNVFLLVGIIVFFGTLGGRLFQILKIPQVVGYITVGIILGLSGIRFINTEILESLQPFNSFALGLIGFMIGGELKIGTIRRFGKQFTYILLMESLGAFILVSGFVTVVGYLLYGNLPFSISLGLLMGAISSATAPAATTDVLWENKTKGPLTTTVLGIVAMDDGVALLLFALASSIASSLLGKSDSGVVMSIVRLMYEIGVAVVLGLITGFALNKIIRRFNDEDKILAFSLGSLLLLIGLAQVLKVDMILSAMSMGFFISNYAPKRSEETFSLVGKFTPPIYVLFFVLVGAKLNILNISVIVGILAIVFLVGRVLGKALGATLGAYLSKAPVGVRKYLPYCLLSQAGVAIGLSIVAGQTFKGSVGDVIIMVVTTTTFVVQIAGPPFVKYAVTKAGEVGLNITEEDLIKQSKARDIADRTIPSISETDSITKILKLFSERDNFYYPVVDKNEKLIGIVSIDHLKDTFIASEFSDYLLAFDIMEPVVVTCREDTEAVSVRNDLKKFDIQSIPMVDETGKVLGMIENRGLQQLFSRRIIEMQSKAKSLEEV
ncbi:MAG: cation:proton antiporter [Spirochaetaceae bacterium]|nr:cation:proton antiporter [Spirochaetaceae bacterium]